MRYDDITCAMNVCIGGTFNPLHKGHKMLIRTACDTAGKKGSVFIGITVGEMIKNKAHVNTYDVRKKTVELFLADLECSDRCTIMPIKTRYGPAVSGDFDAIVVSTETVLTAIEINEKRKLLRKRPLKIIEIPLVLADDTLPISSTRIRNKEIDTEGHPIHT